MSDYVSSYDILYTEIIGCAKEVEDKSQELASLMLKMHEALTKMSDLNKSIKSPLYANLYANISKAVVSAGTFIA